MEKIIATIGANQKLFGHLTEDIFTNQCVRYFLATLKTSQVEIGQGSRDNSNPSSSDSDTTFSF